MIGLVFGAKGNQCKVYEYEFSVATNSHYIVHVEHMRMCVCIMYACVRVCVCVCVCVYL